MESIFIGIAILGLVEFIKAVNAHDYQTAEIIGLAAIVGAVSGFFQVDHLTIITGIEAGLTAAGAYKMGSLIGGK